MANWYNHFHLKIVRHAIVPSEFFETEGTTQVEAIQEIVDRMKTALYNAKVNLNLK